jgi:hypothetical protein
MHIRQSRGPLPRYSHMDEFLKQCVPAEHQPAGERPSAPWS